MQTIATKDGLTTAYAYGRKHGHNHNAVKQQIDRHQLQPALLERKKTRTWRYYNESDLDAIFAERPAEMPAKEPSGTFMEEKTRSEAARADKLEMENARERAETVELAEVRQMLAAVFSVFRSHLEGRGGRHAGQLAGESDPAVIEDLLADEDRRILAAVGARFAAFGTPGGNVRAAGSAGEDGSVAVGGKVPDSAGQ